jgi:prepilin-type N-terminal cleavage/methylation domain-containing protein
MKKRALQEGRTRRAPRRSLGFTLMELMVAVAVFTVVGGVALSLFQQHAKTFTNQQNLVGLNIALRNSLAQIQEDTVNAGDGYYQLASSDWPIGVSITNVAGGYDTLNIITAPTPPAQLPAGTCVTTTSGTATVVPPSGYTAASYASQFAANHEILFINGQGNQLTTGMLTATGTASGTNVTLSYQPTSATGINSTANDPLGISTAAFPATSNDTLGQQFCQATGDWVMPLGTISYTVNGTNQLTRTANGTTDVIANQIISFKVGASTYTNPTQGSSSSYTYVGGYQPNITRSIRVSVIGRTPPNEYIGTTFTNSFDGGNYEIEALSLVINPRNLTMND